MCSRPAPLFINTRFFSCLLNLHTLPAVIAAAKMKETTETIIISAINIIFPLIVYIVFAPLCLLFPYAVMLSISLK